MTSSTPSTNEWIFPSYITYTYDDSNHRLTRTNYNDWGSGFELQGIYTYTYDGDLLTSYEMTLGGTLLMRGTYSYDGNGLCTQLLEEYNDAWGGTGWSNSALTTYTYDEVGNCTNETYSYWQNGWVPDSSIDRLFDANGNCIQREKHTNGLIVDLTTLGINSPTVPLVMPGRLPTTAGNLSMSVTTSLNMATSRAFLNMKHPSQT